ncbi:hypothetical protein BK816_02680 [Boudabousia tangfeifanii]|uniref:Uncharacterized protein n=2 Tax=Boudabousia tangfeifanii TaxID=1912795 RepID=A0A1D9MJH6_9ACTO|nr:hypothetical protein BK816_02680 [Boudabousia tangfeifanii]
MTVDAMNEVMINFKRQKRTKLASLVAVGVLCVGLAGCGGSAASSSTDGVSKEEVSQGIVKIYIKENAKAVPQADFKKVGDCVAEEVDGKISEESKMRIAQGHDIMPNEKDYDVIYKATTKCVEKVRG